MRYGGILLGLMVLASDGLAHPLPSFQFDRLATVTVSSKSIEIRYRLDLSLFAMAIDARGLFTPQEEQAIGGRQKEFAKAYATKKAPLIADQIRARVGDNDLSFQSTVQSVSFEETHVVFEFRFQSDRPSGSKLTIEDQSFEEKPGTLLWRIESNDVVHTIVHADDLANRSPLEMTGDQAKRRRFASAELVTPNQPTLEPTPFTETNSPQRDESLWQSLRSRGLVAFFDSRAGLGILLLAAFLFGAAHAVTPGHGKTLVAAYLVGERGTVWHAVLLGISTTLSHTGSVIAVAIGLRWAYHDGVPETVQGILQLIGGLLILGIGIFLLIQRVRNRADHVHLNFKRTEKPGWFRVMLLGFAGGIVPCWDAVMLLLVAISAGQLSFALPLLLSFSVGLAAVLVGIGMMVVWAARAGGKRFGDSRWFRMLPVVSALALVGLGVWFCRDAWRTLTPPDAQHANR